MARKKRSAQPLRIPSRVRITGRTSYDVVFQERIADDPECLGLCDPEKRTITLKLGLADSELLKTFVHECLHALSAEHGFDLPHRTVYALEECLVRMLKLNGWA
jgi:hypothetical protein